MSREVALPESPVPLYTVMAKPRQPKVPEYVRVYGEELFGDEYRHLHPDAKFYPVRPVKEDPMEDANRPWSLPPAFRYVVDSNELQKGHYGYPIDPRVERRLFAGDYSLDYLGPDGKQEPVSLEKVVAVERKSLQNIAADAAADRVRSEAAIERLGQVKHPHMVIEASWNMLLRQKWRNRIHPHALIGTILAWSTRYRIPVWLTNTRGEGQRTTRWLLRHAAGLYLAELRESANQT